MIEAKCPECGKLITILSSSICDLDWMERGDVRGMIFGLEVDVAKTLGWRQSKKRSKKIEEYRSAIKYLKKLLKESE